MKWCRRLE